MKKLLIAASLFSVCFSASAEVIVKSCHIVEIVRLDGKVVSEKRLAGRKALVADNGHEFVLVDRGYTLNSGNLEDFESDKSLGQSSVNGSFIFNRTEDKTAYAVAYSGSPNSMTAYVGCEVVK